MNLRVVSKLLGVVAVLIGGMMVFSRRRQGRDAIRCLHSEADLDRYCYFVAGVIGRLLTEAFLTSLPTIAPQSRQTLRDSAEAFGAGLQLVNILRDLSADLGRGVCFVPRTLLDEAGLAPEQLVDPAHSGAVNSALQSLFDKARRHLSSMAATPIARVRATESPTG